MPHCTWGLRWSSRWMTTTFSLDRRRWCYVDRPNQEQVRWEADHHLPLRSSCCSCLLSPYRRDLYPRLEWTSSLQASLDVVQHKTRKATYFYRKKKKIITNEGSSRGWWGGWSNLLLYRGKLDSKISTSKRERLVHMSDGYWYVQGTRDERNLKQGGLVVSIKKKKFRDVKLIFFPRLLGIASSQSTRVLHNLRIHLYELIQC